MTPLPHPLYSPLLPQATFVLLFLWMKNVLKGKHFASGQELKPKMSEALKGIKIEEFRDCFASGEKRLDRCITSNGENFEGD